MAHAFIAYLHNDSDFAYIVRQELENAGFRVWMDEDLRAGDDWRTEIDGAIRISFALIVIMSPEARLSEYVTYEWACAWGAEKPVIPIMRRQTELHPRLEAFQYIDFTTNDRRAWPWDILIERLQEEEELSNMYNVPRDAPVAVKRAVAALDSHRADERREAIQTLAQTNHASAREALIAALQHPVLDVRTESAFALFNSGDWDARIVPGIIEAASYGKFHIYALDFEARKKFFRDLATACKSSDYNVVNTLEEMLLSRNPGAREYAAEVLGEIGDTTVIPSLTEALDGPYPRAQEAAEKALKSIGTPEALAAIEEWKQRNPPQK